MGFPRNLPELIDLKGLNTDAHFDQFVNICFQSVWLSVSKKYLWSIHCESMLKTIKHEEKYMEGMNTFYRECENITTESSLDSCWGLEGS